MRSIKYVTESLIETFQKQLVLSYDSISALLGTKSSMTIFRKLKPLDYCTSYSHCGKYYILKRFITFDEYGLWAQGDVRFSQSGSLLNTIADLVKASFSGYFSGELNTILKVRTQNSLKDLVTKNRLCRKQLRQGYLYLFPATQNDQLRHREEALKQEVAERYHSAISQECADHMCWILSLLNEQQARLYLGFESIRLGYGGDVAIAHITGSNAKTVARGRRELEQRQGNADRIRKHGGGRPSIKKKAKSSS